MTRPFPARRASWVVVSVLLGASCPACVHRAIGPSPAERLRRDVERAAQAPVATTAASKGSPGSLWEPAGGTSLVSDTRAYRPGDLVTVAVVERTTGSQEAKTDLSKDATLDLKTPSLFGIEKKLVANFPNFNPESALSTGTQKAFKGDGATSRQTSVVASVTARVVGVYPNGDLALVGQKEIEVNHERQVLTVVGIARPIDLGADNEVSSDRLGELSVHLGGRGDVDAQQREGWLSRLVQRVWPF